MFEDHKTAFLKQRAIDEVMLRMAREYAKMSKCVSHNVGCLITDKDGRIKSSGYNGTPAGHVNCDQVFPEYDPTWREEHHWWSLSNEIHAEQNALIYANRDDIVGGRMYVTLEPCANCAKMIAASGVSTLLFDKKYDKSDGTGLKLLESLGVEVIHIPLEDK